MDQFEDVGFDPIAYLNEKFPDEESLVGLDAEIERLNGELGSVNKELIEEIHEHAMMNIEISEEIKKARELSRQIISEIGVIKDKAKKSEEIVYEMCKDLKSLDIAKKNLTFSIDALKKFIMMVDALDKLSQACQNYKYAEVANLLSAFDELSNHFRKFQAIPQIQDLYKKKAMIVEELFNQITEDFQAFEAGTSSLRPEDMASAATIIEILGEKFWRKFAQAFNRIILKQYEQQYGSVQNSVLENTQRRFGYIKRKLEEFNDKFGAIMPLEWGMDCLLLYEFCSITRLHISKILQRTAASVNVAILMKALEFSLRFESSITELMSKKYGELVARSNKRKYDLQSLPKFTGSISNSFEPYLNPYIKSEEEALCEALMKVLDDDKLVAIKVYNSSIVLFHGVKNSIRRAGNYSRGSLLLDILKVVKKVFRIYSEKCFDKSKRPGDLFEETMCWVINTAEYCKTAIEGAKECFENTIDPIYVDSVDFAEEEQLFSNLISKSIEVLIAALEGRVDSNFTQITRVQWDKMEEMSDVSAYVREVRELLRGNFARVKEQMQSLYLTLYMDKLIVLVASKFLQNIYKCKKLPQSAYQVLHMDVIELKETLLAVVKSDTRTYSNPKIMQKHVTFVNRSFSKGENIIKLLGLPNDQFAERFEMLVEGASTQELDRILQVRGGKKGDFPALVKSIESKMV